MIFLDSAATRRALPMTDAIRSMRDAFSADVDMPLRVELGSSLFMPGRVGKVSGIKVVSVVPGNPVGIVAIFGEDGNALGLVDGPTLTAIRTGAVAGLATDILAPTDASTLAMLGAGAMAYDQIEGIREVRDLSRILVWSRSRDHAESLAEKVGGAAVANANLAVESSAIISCATPSTEPLFLDSAVRAGSHINAVGSFRPEMVEVPPETVRRAYVVVDDRQAAATEAGDILQAGRDPDITLTELLSGGYQRSAGSLTFFKSVGVSTQDVAAGHVALVNAQRLGVGTEIP